MKAEQKADDAAAKEEVLRSYTVLPGQTCGQGHGADNVKVAGAETLVRSPAECTIKLTLYGVKSVLLILYSLKKCLI